VFPTPSGSRRDKDNARERVIRPVVAAADELLARRGHDALLAGVTAHKLRHTFASILYVRGEDPPYVMAQIGHADPGFTLRVYAHAMRRDEGDKERLKALVEGRDWAPLGTSGVEDGSSAPATELPDNDETPGVAGASDDGRGGFRTCDLSRVKGLEGMRDGGVWLCSAVCGRASRSVFGVSRCLWARGGHGRHPGSRGPAPYLAHQRSAPALSRSSPSGSRGASREAMALSIAGAWSHAVAVRPGVAVDRSACPTSSTSCSRPSARSTSSAPGASRTRRLRSCRATRTSRSGTRVALSRRGRLLIGRTDGGRVLTLVIERTVDPTTWLIVTGWGATLAERRMLRR
jgi:Phage integrase family